MNSERVKVIGIVVVGAVLAVAAAAFAFVNLGVGQMDHDVAPPPATDTSETLSVRVVEPGFQPGGGHDFSGWERIRGTVPVEIDAEGPIQKVEYYLGQTLLHTSTESPFAWEFDTTPYEDCMYYFTAKAYGPDAGTVTDSTQVWIDNNEGNCR